MGAAKSNMPAWEDAFQEIRQVIGARTGVQLGDKQRVMVENRIKKRAYDLGLKGLTDYAPYYFAHKDTEALALVSLLTTHHTYFFREFAHFEFFEKQLPQIIECVRARGDNTIRIWSAACSRGQEVYSLAMHLDLLLKKMSETIDFEILGSDVDPESVSIAKNGVFTRNEVKDVPLAYFADHWVRGKGELANFVKARDSLRKHCRFKTVNLLNFKGDMAGEKFDIIFCRNVFIYFDPKQIEAISKDFVNFMTPDGLLLIGISESLFGMDVGMKAIGPSVYARVGSKFLGKREPARPISSIIEKVKEPTGEASFVRPTLKVPIAAAEKTFRVLVVDDSPSIHAIMKKILSKEDGFEVVGIAKSGLEAAKMVRDLKPDALTLDIHMPEQGGIEYLEKNLGGDHPPVVMVSSVSREDAGLAVRALSLGASDYVEKPSLTNMLTRGDEIRTKLRTAIKFRSRSGELNKIDDSFKKKRVIMGCGNKLRIILGGLADLKSIAELLAELDGPQPASIILIEGATQVLPEAAKSLALKLKKSVDLVDKLPNTLRIDGIYLADFAAFAQLGSALGGRKTVALVYGEPSGAAREALRKAGGLHVLAEDLGEALAGEGIRKAANDVVPATSFAWMSSEWLANQQ